MHANKMRLNKLNDSVLTVNYTVERRKKKRTHRKRDAKRENKTETAD